MTLFVVAILVALTVSFFCSMLEACLLSLSKSDLARIAERQPASARIWSTFKSNIQKPLAVILIINTFAHTIGASVSGAQFNKLFGDKWIAAFSLIFSLVMIQWTEILPKSLAVRYNQAIARVVAVPFNVLVFFFKPIVIATEWLNHPFKGKPGDTIESTISDIRVLARSAALENLLSKEQEKLISRSVLMSSLKARDVMIGRDDINVLSTAMSLQDGLIAAHQHRHTRFPLAEAGDIDRIVGYVNFKDIVGALHVNPGNPSLRGVMRQVVFLKESTRVPELLAKLTRGYQHIAIVQNDTGATRGLVTLEDIIETLVGELQDEYDTPPDFIVQLSENRFRAGGGATFRQIRARAFSDLSRDDDVTIDAWIKGELNGKEPTEQYSCAIAGFAVKIRRVVRGNIYDVIVERTATASPVQPSAA